MHRNRSQKIISLVKINRYSSLLLICDHDDYYTVEIFPGILIPHKVRVSFVPKN